MFADQAGTNCSITDTAPGLLPIYVVHIVDAGATAIQYIAAKPACMTSTYLSDTNPFGVTIGNSQTGVSVGYGTCRSGAIHCQTISYFASGTTRRCCVYTVHCDPSASTNAPAVSWTSWIAISVRVSPRGAPA